MRIIGGVHRGRALAAIGAGDAKARLRPTSDRVRESIFNLLAHAAFLDREIPEGARVLDLFAGTGALGLEALSRGADTVTFFESGRPALKLLKQNIETLSATRTTQVLSCDALRPGLNEGVGYDLVFLDPPYNKGLGEKALGAALQGNWIAANAVVVWEEGRDVSPPDGFAMQDIRRYGDTIVHFLTRT